MSKSNTTHRAALEALSDLLSVTQDLEYRLASLAECVDGLEDDVAGMLRDAGKAMTKASRVIAASAAQTSTEPAPSKGKRYRVTCVCDQTNVVVADNIDDAIHRVMCGEGELTDTETHDFVVTRLTK